MVIADLHIHSKYSRATSRDLDPAHLDLWARRKGIQLVGTGDFTHPAWRQELREALIPAEDGLYRLRPDHRIPEEGAAGQGEPRFVLSAEISSIYKKNGRVRKVHNVILLPGLEEADRLSARLEAIGNIHSDGRPILGLDCRDLLEITLESCSRAVFIPAHIWTPHFSLFGAFSGFDTIEECFADLTPHIFALETGLSSDPAMNWRLSALDRYALVSHSDAHSPGKLGREANVLDIEYSYDALAAALRGRGAAGFKGTIEFYPEEGKYHLDGHRKCGLCLSPSETRSVGGRCPVCGGKLTVGVLHRVEALADRPEGYRPPDAPGYESLVPLPEIIAASTGGSATGVKTARRYQAMLQSLGPEFTILRELPLPAIEAMAGPLVTEGIRRVRAGEIRWEAGYDGEFGRVRILDDMEMGAMTGQISLFAGAPSRERKKRMGEKVSIGRGDVETAAETAPAYEMAPLSLPPVPQPGGANTPSRVSGESSAPLVSGGAVGKPGQLGAPMEFLQYSAPVKADKVGISSEPARANTAPEPSRADAAPESARANTAPEPSRVDATPESAKTNTVPESSRADAAPESAKTNTVPESSRANTAPGSSRVDATPESAKTNTVPESSRADATPESGGFQKLAAASRQADMRLKCEKSGTAVTSGQPGPSLKFGGCRTSPVSGKVGTRSVAEGAGRAAEPQRLNPEQRAAVSSEAAVLAVIAGPGTGKTSVLAARVRYLLEQGASARRITAVTFTHKAADEMRERLSDTHTGRGHKEAPKADGVTIGTFHSICLCLLQRAGVRVNLAGEGDCRRIAAETLAAAGEKLSPGRLIRMASARKNGAAGGEALSDQLFDAYCRRLAAAGLMDFDDLLLFTLRRFETGAAGPEERAAFSFLLVDEFQDVNPIQYRLIRAWKGQTGRLFVIGDPDQAIYGFRGAADDCFVRLMEDEPDTRVIRLIQNYRSTPEIIGCALPAIRKNPSRAGERRLEAAAPAGERVRLIRAADSFAEALFVAKEIGRMVGGMDMLEAGASSRPSPWRMRPAVPARRAGSRGFSDIAVLYRTHRQAEALETCFKMEGIPYTVTGRDDFLQAPVVQGLLSLLRLADGLPAGLAGPDSALPAGLAGPDAALPADPTAANVAPPDSSKASDAASAAGLNASGVALPAGSAASCLIPTAALEAFSDVGGPGLLSLVRKLTGRRLSACPRVLLEELVAALEVEDDPAVDKLISASLFHDTLTDFLQTLLLGGEADVRRAGGKTYVADAVRLMTLHGAKGLEFPVAFLCGVSQGVLPLDRPGLSADPEEERRLFYVGLTRAKEELVLCTYGVPSTFLGDLPAALLTEEQASDSRPLYGGRQLSLF